MSPAARWVCCSWEDWRTERLTLGVSFGKFGKRFSWKPAQFFTRSLPPCFALKSPKVQSHFVAQSFVYGDSLKTQPGWHDWWIGLKYPSFCDYFVTTDSLDWYLEPILGLHRSTGIPTALWCRLVAIVVPDPDTAASWAKQREPQKIPTKWADQTIILISFIVRRATKTAMDDQRWP